MHLISVCFALAGGVGASSLDAYAAQVSGAGELVAGQVATRKVAVRFSREVGSQDEIPQMPGWPKTTGRHANFVPARGAVFADLNGDGKKEILVPSTEGKVYAWYLDGSSVSGFPVATVGFPQYPPSVGDLDGDGVVEIVQTTRGFTSGGRLYVFGPSGNVLPGWPKSLNNNNVEYSAVLADLDGDGKLEIIVGERAWPTGYLHVFRKDGSEWGGNWPVALDHVPAMTASVGDVDGNGSMEVLYASYDSLYLLKADGTSMPGWPRQISGSHFSYQSAALADLDGDGKLEIVTGAHQGTSGIYVFRADGTLYPGWPKATQTWTYCAPTVTDLENDGSHEIIGGQAGGGFANPCFWVWNPAGQIRSGFPYTSDHGGGSEGPLTVADVDGDGSQEIFADHNYMVGGQGYLFGVNASGQNLPGFPLRTAGFTYLNSATIGDVDNDGHAELGVIATDSIVTIYLYTLPWSYAPSSRDWPTYHARNTRGGLYAPAKVVAPTGFSVVFGTVVGGDLSSLLSSDGNSLNVQNGNVFLVTQSPITVEYSATAPGGRVSKLDWTYEGHVSLNGLTQRLDLYDYNGDAFTQVDQRLAPVGSDVVITVSRTTDAANFVRSSDRQMKSRLRVRDDAPAFLAAWIARTDFVSWSLTQ